MPPIIEIKSAKKIQSVFWCNNKANVDQTGTTQLKNQFCTCSSLRSSCVKRIIPLPRLSLGKLNVGLDIFCMVKYLPYGACK